MHEEVFMTAEFPAYTFGEPRSGSCYARYESGRDLNYYTADPNLRFVLEGYLSAETLAWAEPRLHTLGERCGTVIVHRADTVDRVGHELVRYDRFGRDISEIAYHPDWLTNLNEVFDFGLVGWNHHPSWHAQTGYAPVPLLAALDYLVGQADMALCCPLELAHGTVMVLEQFADPSVRDRFLSAVTATSEADRLQVAQVATEITGGSDVGASRTEAEQIGGEWYLSGEKWFASNIGADLILTLGRVTAGSTGTAGLGMFLVPRRKPDGSPNGISIRRLKDKMGTRGVPTGELLLNHALAFLIGDPAHGFHYMAVMLNHTWFWNAVGSLGVMRRAYVEAAVYAARRPAFGTSLDAFPMVCEQLVQMTVDLEATTALIFETAYALEAAKDGADATASLRFRTLAPVVKYRAGEQNVTFTRAAVEMLGGNGYVSTFGTPRLLRDAQVNTIWEGTSNICALDLWRAITKQQGQVPLLERAEVLVCSIKTGPAKHLATIVQRGIEDVRVAIGALEGASQTRRQQQARRLADLLGDVMALAVLTAEADRGVTSGDYRKALVGELFALRFFGVSNPLEAVLQAGNGIPECYEVLMRDGACGKSAYETLVQGLGSAQPIAPCRS